MEPRGSDTSHLAVRGGAAQRFLFKSTAVPLPLGHAPSFWAEGRPGDGILPARCFASTSTSAASIQNCLNLAISSSWASLIVSFKVAWYFFKIW